MRYRSGAGLRAVLEHPATDTRSRPRIVETGSLHFAAEVCHNHRDLTTETENDVTRYARKSITLLSIAFLASMTLHPSGTPRALAQDPPEDPAAEVARLNNEAFARFGEGRFDEVISLLDRALEISPADGETLYNKACVLAHSGKPDDALDSLGLSAEVGFAKPHSLWHDADLASLRSRPDFVELLEDVVRARRQDVLATRAALEERREAGRVNSIEWRDGHTDQVHGTLFSPDGLDVLTWGGDGRVIVWNPDTGECLRFLGSYSSRFLDVSFVADGRRVTIFDRLAGQLAIWDPRSARRIATLGTDEDTVLAEVITTPQQSEILTLDDLGRFQRIDAIRGRPVRGAASLERLGRLFTVTPTFPRAVRSRDGHWLALSTGGHIRDARLIDASNGKEIRTWSPAPGGEAYLDFTRDGSRLVVHRFETPPVANMNEAIVEVWDLGDTPAKRIERPTWTRYASANEPDPPPAWSSVDRRGRRLLTLEGVDEGFALRCYDVDTGRKLHEWPTTAQAPGWLFTVVGPNGERAIACDTRRPVPVAGDEGFAKLLDLETGSLIGHHQGPAYPVGTVRSSDDGGVSFHVTGRLRSNLEAFDGRSGIGLGTFSRNSTLRGFSLAPHGDRVAVGGFPSWAAVVSPSAGITDLDSHALDAAWIQPLRADASPSGQEELLALASQSRWVPSAGRQALRLDAATGRVLGDLAETRHGLTGASVRGDGKRVFVTGGQGSWLYDLPAATLAAEIPRANGISSASWTADGQRVILSRRSAPTTVQIWRVAPAGSPADVKLVRRLPSRAWPHLPDSPPAVCSPTENYFVMANRSGEAEIRDDHRGRVIENLGIAPAGDWKRFDFSPDGRWLLGSAARAVLWDTTSWEVVAELHADDQQIFHSAFSPDGSRFATGHAWGNVHVARVGDPPAAPIQLESHSSWVSFVAFSADGTRLVSCGDDGIARISDARTGAKLVECIGHDAGIRCATFAAGDTRLVTAGSDGTFRHFDAATGRLLATTVAYRGGWMQFEPGGHYRGTPGVADWARIDVDGTTYPLSSYAEVLEAPELVDAALAGERVEPHAPLDPAPEVTILSPEPGLQPDRSFQLRVQATDVQPVTGICVFVDGVEVKTSGPIDAKRSGRGEWTSTLELPLRIEGIEAEIVVRAENELGILSWPESLRVQYDPPSRDLYVLAIGVGDYDDDTLDLAYATKDVDDLIARLGREAGDLYDKVHVKRLVNDEVTKGAIPRLRAEHLRKAKPEDTILVFVAGHGVKSDSDDYYFLTPDATPSDPYDGIERDALSSLVNWDKLSANRRILFLDTCHAGESIENKTRGVGVVEVLYDQQQIDEALGSGIYVVAASSEQGYAEETDGNGIFTRALLDALDGAADRDNNGSVEIREILDFVANAVHERTDGRQRPTLPQVTGGENFPVTRVAK